jgi:arginine repressor
MLEAVEKFPIRKQEDFVDILIKHYGIETNQSAISRDLRELDIELDFDTKTYVLGTRAQKKKELKSLSKLFKQARATKIDGEISTFFLKAGAEYSHLIAAHLESLLSKEGIYISSFIGQSGSLMICIPKDKKERVESILKKIIG